MFNRNLFFLIPCLVAAGLTLGQPAFSQSRINTFETEHDRHVARFSEVLRILNEKYVDVDKVDYDTLIDAAIYGMLGTLDPHTQYLSRERFSSLREETRQEFGGIGVRIERRDNRVTVISPIANTPGERAGLLPGDLIVAVDGEDTTDHSTNEISNLLRGTPGTSVFVTLYRPQTEETIEVTLERETIELESVPEARMRDDGIGYIRIARFGERTGNEFRNALDKLEDEGMQALVIDLRNNPGGLLSASVEVAGQFFTRNEMVIYTEERNAEVRQEIRSRTSAREKEYPIAILINSGSASAAEIVAGSLKDTKRAVIVGETSFGKGSVQRVEALRGGTALRYTSARYYTPAGLPIHEKGVEPDIRVTVSTEEASQLMRQRSRPDLTPGEFAKRFGFEPIEDKQLQAAIETINSAFLHAEAPVEKGSPDS